MDKPLLIALGALIAIAAAIVSYKTDWRKLGQIVTRLDWVALACTLALLLTGVSFIYSAGYQNGSDQWWKQLLYIGLGIPIYLAAALIDVRHLRDLAFLLYFLAIGLLVAVLFFGTEYNGSKSWFAIGPIHLQPSELAKPAMVLALAAYLGEPMRNPRRAGSIAAGLLIIGLPFVLILLQPDMGTGLILPCIGLAMLFVSGLPKRVMATFALGIALAAPLTWPLLKPHQQERIMVFLDPNRDPLGGGWNKLQSEIAVGSGGLTGKGFLQGTQNILGFLPRTVAPTDFIYSVIAEEMGFVGCALVLGLYGVLFIAIARTGLRAQDTFGRLIVVGILARVFAHVTVNVAMTVGLMPIIGLPLPLVSYGGSFVLSILLALGLVQGVYIRRS